MREEKPSNSQTQLTVEDAFKQAIDHFNAECYTESDKLCTAIIQAAPNHIYAINLLGVIAQKLNRHDLAVEQFKKAINIDNNIALLYYNLGASLYPLGRREEAIQVLQTALDKEPGNGQITNYLNGILNASKPNAEIGNTQINAKEALQKGVAYHQSGQLDDAIHWYRKTLEIQPTNTAALSNLGNALKEQGNVEDALIAYKQLACIEFQVPFNIFDENHEKLSKHEQLSPVEILALLSNEQHCNTIETARYLEKYAPESDAPQWQGFAKSLGYKLFETFHINKAYVLNRNYIPTELLAVCGRLIVFSRIQHFSTFPSFDQMMEEVKIQEKYFDNIRLLIYISYLAEINLRLQSLYRTYLGIHHQSSHKDSLDSLQKLEHSAYTLIAQTKPIAMLKWLGKSLSNQQHISLFFKRLSNYYFHFNSGLNFRFTHRCNISCSHCFNFSGPKASDTSIPIEDMKKIIEEIPNNIGSRMIVSGGEPFLYQKELLIMIQTARANDVFIVSLNTNGFWAKNFEKGKMIIRQLIEAGNMDGIGVKLELKVSTGIYHQEHIEFKTIANLAEAFFLETGNKIKIDYEVHNEVDISNGLQLLKQYYVEKKVDVIFRKVLYIGRGAEIEPDTSAFHPVGFFGKCSTIDMIAFDPDGSARPCCGMSYNVPGLTIGNIKSGTLKDFVKNANNNPILQFFNEHPIGDFFSVYDIKPKEAAYDNICSVCKEIFNVLEDREDIFDKISTYQQYFPFWFSHEKLEIFSKTSE